MPGSSGMSMKKTIGHRGVETTTGETTYKKVRGEVGVSDNSDLLTPAALSRSDPRCLQFSGLACMFWCLYSKISLEVPLAGNPRIVSETAEVTGVKCCLFQYLLSFPR